MSIYPVAERVREQHLLSFFFPLSLGLNDCMLGAARSWSFFFPSLSSLLYSACLYGMFSPLTIWYRCSSVVSPLPVYEVYIFSAILFFLCVDAMKQVLYY